MAFKKSILISNDIWEKVKSNNNNFSSIKKKKKKSSSPPIKKPKLQEDQKQKLLTIPKHSIRYELNGRARERRKKSNLMKNGKILAKGIRADEEILNFFRPNEKPFIYRLLKFLRINGDVITWDDDTLEVNINGQDYPGSSIVDILSYLADKNSNDLFYTTGDYDTTDRLMLGMPQNTIEVVKALNYLIPSGGYDDLFQKLGFDMKKAHRLGEIKKKKQIENTKVFNTKAKQYNKNDLEAEEERAKRRMRRSLGIMGELEDQYDRDKKSYSDSKYSTFIQREQNDPRVKMNKHQGDVFLQYQKGALSREEATDKILRHALKSRRRQLFKHDDDDDVQGAEGGKESEDDEEEFFDSSDVIFSPEDRERALIRKNIQTDKVLDLIANTAPTIAQQAQTPTIAQQADMYNLRTTAERKPTQKFTPSTYNNQQKTKKKKQSGSEKRRRRRKIRQTENEEKEKI